MRLVTAASRKRMADAETWRPAAPVPWTLIGTALDYRLRFYFPWQGHAQLVAYYGARTACSEISAPLLQDHGVKQGNIDTTARRLDRKVPKNFFASLERFVRRVQPERRRLDKADEDALLRYCIVLAAFVVFCGEGSHERSILLTPQPKISSNELLAIAKPHWLDDLREMSWGFFNNFHVLLNQQC